MDKLASFALILILALGMAAFSQDSKRTDRPELRADKPLSDSSSAPETSARPVPPSSESLDFTISKNVDEVNLILSITDMKGRFVSDLTAGDLKLLDDNKAPEKWNYFQARTNLPLHVILAIDVSSSIRSRTTRGDYLSQTFPYAEYG